MGIDPSPRSSPITLNIFATEEADDENNYAKLVQLQDRPTDQSEELIEIKLANEGKEASPVF